VSRGVLIGSEELAYAPILRDRVLVIRFSARGRGRQHRAQGGARQRRNPGNIGEKPPSPRMRAAERAELINVCRPLRGLDEYKSF